MGEDQGSTDPVRYGTKIPLTEAERRDLTTQHASLPERRRKRYWPIALILVAIAIVVGLMLYPSLKPASGDSPEDAFRGFVDAMNAGDAREAIEHTVDAFINDSMKAAEIMEMEQIWAEQGSMTITIHSMDVVYRKDMGALVGSEIDMIVAEVEGMWNVDVEDSAGLTFSATVSQGGETNDAGGSIPVLKIDGSWYLAPSILAM